MNLNHHIIQLEEAIVLAAEGAKSERRAECNNLLQIIWEAKELLNEGMFSEADEILNEVGKRVNALIADPESSGNHNQYKPSK